MSQVESLLPGSLDHHNNQATDGIPTTIIEEDHSMSPSQAQSQSQMPPTSNADASADATSRSVFFGSVANLCSATLGAGILALPFAFYQAGLVCGMLLLLVSGWATCASIQLLVHACHLHSIATYEQVVEHVLGRSARKVVEWSILIFCIGCAVAYIIAVGDILQQILTFPMSKSTKHWSMVVVWFLAMLPLSSLRRMQSLQCASAVGITSIGILLLATTVHLIQQPDGVDFDGDDGMERTLQHHAMLTQEHGTLASLRQYMWPADNSWLSVLRACPIVFFAFSCQVNVCQIYDELPTPAATNGATDASSAARSKKRTMNMVAMTAVTMCGILYSSISLVTLTDFGSAILPNILSCYSPKTAGPLMHVAFVAMALAVVMAYPLNIFPARVSILHMMHTSKRRGSSMCSHGDEECRTPMLPRGSDSGSSTHDNNNNAERNEQGPAEQHGNDGSASSPLHHHQHVPLSYSDRGVSMVTAANSSMHSHDSGSLSDAEDPLLLASNDNENNNTIDNDNDDSDAIMINMPEEDVSYAEHLGITLALSGLTLLLALVLPNISVVFGLLGGTTSSLLGFVIPGMLGIATSNARGNSSSRSDTIASWVLVVAGTIVGVLTTGVTVYGTIQDLI
eukprot:CAMPEP_0119570972 /NCGR_PEP_ID=MMETSP1352-20130426/43886_1 /TAXON_ID=265584 /ORGANISM="Stauroneis constricta, Strain CCMP1120" /LENGTH=624 /DNA_ID=CAMNT_0007620649 /DNA_START=41 /DNA_END=1915 /DNA_ORIENTATION=+